MNNITADIANDASKSHTAMNIKELTCLAYGNGFTLWRYRAEGKCRLDDVLAPGFFDEPPDSNEDGLQSLLSPGDHVHISAPDGGGLALVVKVGAATVLRLMCSANFALAV